jgi:hypothetical protein
MAAAALPVLAACDTGVGAGPAPRAPAKVVFWNYGGGGVSDQLFEAVATEYRQQFPEVTLERTGIPSAEIQDKLVVSCVKRHIEVALPHFVGTDCG